MTKITPEVAIKKIAKLETLLAERDEKIAKLETLLAERDRKISELGRLYNTDALTGLPDRGAFNAKLPREMQTAARHGQPLCLAILDIDHFKSVNDTHGHLAGDQVLKELGVFLQIRLRPSDFLARYGGEEFVIILSHTYLSGARSVLERLRKQIKEEFFVEIDGGCKVCCTVSIGVSECGLDSLLDPKGLLKEADDLLYKAKKQGRNRVVAN